MKKIIALVMVCVMILAVVAGCGNSGEATTTEKNDDRVLRIRANKSLASLDWQATTNTADMQVTWVQMFEGLYGMDEAHGGYYNLLAKDVQVSDDGLTYTITLQDATFQNGDKLTAQDVKFSYELAMQNSRFNYVTSMIKSMEAKDEKTFVMTLEYPYSAISHTFWSIKVYSEREYNEVVNSGVEFGTVVHTACTGPYICTEYNPASGSTFKAYENYWGGCPDIKNVEYRYIQEDSAAVIAYENGEIDYFTDCPLSDWDNISAAAGENCDLAKGNNIRFLAINYLSPSNDGILANEKVREAIFHAVNKDNIVTASTNGYGQVAYEYMPHEYVATSPNVADGNFATYDFDADLAHQCLLDAGFSEADIKAGIPVGTIMTYGAETAEKGKAAVVIQACLKDAGMIADVQVSDASAITPQLYGQKYDLAIFADSGNYDYNNIRQQVHSESVGMYLVRFCDPASPFNWQRLEELCDEGVATADVAERYKIYTELWKIVMDTKTILPLYHNAVGVAWSDAITLDGICPTYYHIDQMHWK